MLDNISTIQEVQNYPTVKFRGYPAAHIVPSSNDAAYESTSENVRNYVFSVRVFYETKRKGMSGALSALEKIVDSVIDAFDQDDQKSGSNKVIGVSLPSGYTFLNIWATPSLWGEIPGEDLIMAEITVSIRISRDAT